MARVGFVSTRRVSREMFNRGGYREKNIIKNARFAVQGNKGRTITFYKKHNASGRYDKTKFDTCTYDLKNNRWVG